ncbi:hypothetical protein GGI11_001371 [Coemansia sp. RSA 2049]|nr:hypothetical protein GGI11_001371 [Coemansia sp. RSA 2049]
MDSVIYVLIANEFNALSKAQWIVTSNLIAVTCLQPIYGKLSDITGRKIAVYLAAALLAIGSTLSASSGSINMLIASRVIEGFGSSGVVVMTNIIVADLLDEKSRAAFMGLTYGVSGIASIGGTALGGYLVQRSIWRVVYWINIPISIIIASVVLLLVKLPNPPPASFRDKLARIDFGGVALFILFDQYSSLGEIIGFQSIAGIGAGACTQILIFAAQVASSSHDLAVVTSICIFLRSIGSVIVVAVLSSVNNNILHSNFGRLASAYPEYSSAILSVSENQSLINSLDLPQHIVHELTKVMAIGRSSEPNTLVSTDSEEVLSDACQNIEAIPEEQAIGGKDSPSLVTGVGICVLMFFIGMYMTMDSVIFVPVANYFNALPRADWIVNSYLITTTALQPLYAKCSDILGRKLAIVVAATLLVIGSILCAASQSMNMLIASRAMQGLGSAGMYTMLNVVIADLYSESGRAIFMGISSGLWGLSSAGGTVLGGTIVQLSTWRVVYWINVPISLIAVVLILKYIPLPKPSATSTREKLLRIDFGGALIMTFGIVFILLALSWGGREYSWSSARVLSFLIIGVIAVLGFFYYENKIPSEPILPFRLLRTRNVALAFVSELFFGAASYAPLIFIPQWALVVKNATPITSGLYTLPLSLFESISVLASGLLVTKSGRYREILWVGSLFLLAGLTPFVTFDQHTGLGRIIGFQILAGIGFGACIQNLVLAAQVSSIGYDSAVATSVCIFMRSIGAILVVSVLSSVNGNILHTKFDQIIAAYPDYTSDIRRISENQSLINKLDIPQPLFNDLINAFMKGMHGAFIALIPFSALLVLSVIGIKHIPLAKIKKITLR